VRTNENKNTL